MLSAHTRQSSKEVLTILYLSTYSTRFNILLYFIGHCSVIYTAEGVEPSIVEGCFYRKLFTLKLAVLRRTSKITSLIYYLCKHSQRPQKLTYSYTQIFWVSCDQPMLGPFPFPNLRKGPGIEVEKTCPVFR